MLYLEKDLFLENLEKRASPYQVAQTLYCRWENEKSNLQYFLRAGIECWYWLDNDIFWNNYLKQDELKDFEEILTTYLCKVCVYCCIWMRYNILTKSSSRHCWSIWRTAA